MRRLTLLASAVALGVIASGAAVSQSSSAPLGRDARRDDNSFPIGQQPQSEPKKQPRLDVHGDPLPEGAVARLGTTRLRHEPSHSDGWVARAISPDGKILATTSWHEARFWSLEDGKLLRQFPIEGPASPIAITPDGKGFVACRINQKFVDFYDVATGRRLRSIPYPSPQSATAAISPDCRTIASTLDEETVQVLDAESGKERQRLRGRNLRGTGLIFARDGKSLITPGTRICRWDLSTGKELSDVTIDVESGFEGMLQKTRGMRLSFDGKSLAVIPLREPVRIYDTETGKVRLVLEGDKAVCCGQLAFAFSPDDRVLLIYSWDNDRQHPAVASFWDARTGKLLRRFDDPCRTASPWVIQAEFSPDGKLVMSNSAMGNDHALRFWDPLTGRRVLHVDGHETAVTSLTFSSDGRQLISSSGLENSIRTWDIRSHRQRGIVQGPSRWDVFSQVNDQKVVTANPDGAQVRDLATGKEGLRFPFDRLTSGPAYYGWAKWVAVSPDERTAVIFGSAGSEQVVPGKHQSLTRMYGWDLTSGRLLFKRDQADELDGPRLSPDTRVLARFLHTKIPIGDPEDPSFRLTTRLLLEETSTGRQLPSIPLPNYHHEGRFAYSADGQLMATMSYQLKNEKKPNDGVHKHAIHIWETASGQECSRIALSEKSAVPSGMTFSPDGRFLAVSEYEQTLRVFDLATGKEQEGLRIPLVKEPKRYNAPVMPPMTFSPDGRWMAVCQRDHVLSIFDLERGKETGHYAGHPSEAQCLSFSPDSKFLATGHSDATILLWDVSAATANPALAAKPVPTRVETLWAALAGSDAAEAHRAILGLAATPESAVPWLKNHLKAAAAIPAEDVNQAIAGLDDPTFAKREAASKKLTEWEELAETAMRAALTTKLSGEQRRRIEVILRASRPVPKSEMLRQLRSVRVLERIAAPRAGATRLAATDLLKKLAAGAPEARLTQEAKTSLERLEKQRKVIEE